jgi:hypothetical protein
MTTGMEIAREVIRLFKADKFGPEAIAELRSLFPHAPADEIEQACLVASDHDDRGSRSLATPRSHPTP